MRAHGLVDPTEMYLRTIVELEEDGVVPLRARIAERLGQSGPTVSQTVARMQRDGLVLVARDRRLVLTGPGRGQAVRVMRRHRLAECFLADVIGLRWEDVHIEASRWQHVMSDAVAGRLTELLGHPATCPHGSPIPTEGGGGTGTGPGPALVPFPVLTLTGAATPVETTVTVVRIGEPLQNDPSVLLRLARAGIRPRHEIAVTAGENAVRVRGHEPATIPHGLGDHIFVEPRTGTPRGGDLA
ncbi:metal-dependent transcriptional regulator [Streptomyces tagetis]|uniref:Metal-dependent transcriptional regulator n=1 Tax=Streptomyces tagetis TaxID=2820809 RepID=A0A940XK01_9ACTN|nr:metal-dependent transcriptional regulator [Streptomyces sp. RG38]MBQ0825929.1 metal-dependent transcriptional regulator [Streptomyces sp. RG38]